MKQLIRILFPLALILSNCSHQTAVQPEDAFGDIKFDYLTPNDATPQDIIDNHTPANAQDIVPPRDIVGDQLAPANNGPSPENNVLRHLVFSDSLDLTQEAPAARRMGKRPVSMVAGVVDRAVLLNGNPSAANQVGFSAKATANANNAVTKTDINAEAFLAQCQALVGANAPVGNAGVNVFMSPQHSPQISRLQRDLQIELKNLRGHGTIELSVQLYYYDDEQGRHIRKHTENGIKPNFTLPVQTHVFNSCDNETNAIFYFDLFSMADAARARQEPWLENWKEQNRLGLQSATSVNYTVAVQLKSNSIVSASAPIFSQSSADNPDTIATLHYILPEIPEANTIQFFFKPTIDLQKNPQPQVLFELSGGENSLQLIVENNQARLVSENEMRELEENSFFLDPLRWDLLGLTIKQNSVELFSREQSLAELNLPDGAHFETLCLGARCDGEDPAAFSFDELEVLNNDQPLSCRNCTADNNGIQIFQTADQRIPDAYVRPNNNEFIETISSWGNAGDLSNVVFGLHPEKSFNDVSFRVSDLRFNGTTIPSANIEIFLAKYWKQIGAKKLSVELFDEYGLTSEFVDFTPELLLKDDRKEFTGRTELDRNDEGKITHLRFPSVEETLQSSLHAWENKLIWLQVNVPANAAAGGYTGTFELVQDDTVLFSLPLSFEVKRLQLRRPDQLKPFLGIYFRDRLNPLGGGIDAQTEEELDRHLNHLQQLGINGIEVRYQRGDDDNETKEKYRSFFQKLQERSISKIVLSPCVHPLAKKGPADFSIYNIAKNEFHFDVSCYGQDEPGVKGMHGEMSIVTLNTNHASRQYGQELGNEIKTLFLKLSSIPEFQQSVMQYYNIAAKAQGETEQVFSARLMTALNRASSADRKIYENQLCAFYDQARANAALLAQVNNAIPPAMKRFAAEFNRTRAANNYPRTAAANFKEISLWMDGCTLEKLEQGNCENLANFPSETLVGVLTDKFLPSDDYQPYGSNPYKRIHRNFSVPFDILGITNAGLDISILSSGSNSRNAVYQEYVRERVKSIRDDVRHFPGQKPRNTIFPNQQEWIYFGNGDSKAELPLTRFQFGFYAYIAQLDGVFPYVYQHPLIGAKGRGDCAANRPAYFVDGVNVNCSHTPDYEDPFLDFDGLKLSGRPDQSGIPVEKDTLEKDDLFVYESAQGPIKTVMSENIHEGILDYRYLETAEKLILAHDNNEDYKARFRAILRPFQDAVINQETPCKYMLLCGENRVQVEENMDDARRALAELIEELPPAAQ